MIFASLDTVRHRSGSPRNSLPILWLFPACLFVVSLRGASIPSASGLAQRPEVSNFIAQNGATELIADGGFEESPNARWTQTSTAFGTPVTPVTCGSGLGSGPHGGSRIAWFGGNSVDAEDASLEQSVTIPPGVGPLTFWYATPQCENSASFLNASIDGSVVFQIDCSQANPEYRQASIDVSSWANGSAHVLKFHSHAEAVASDSYLSEFAVSNYFLDDVSLPVGSIRIDDVTKAEGNSATTAFLFPISVAPPPAQDVLVDWATAPGTADGSDFVSTSGTVRLTAAAPVSFAAVNVIGDTLKESAHETFFVHLSNPRNAMIARGEAVGTIVDDDTSAADLSISMPAALNGPADTPTPLLITVHNSGPDAATSPAVTAVLSPGLVLLSATASQGSCSASPPVTCNLGPLSSGANATVLLSVSGDEAGVLTTTAMVTNEEADPTTPNSATSTVTISGATADLSVSLPATLTGLQGEWIPFDVTVHNSGPDIASSPVMTDVLPAALTLDLVTPSQGSCSGPSTVVCTLGPLDMAASATIHFRVSGSQPGTVSHTATLTNRDSDPTTPNVATSNVTIVTVQRFDVAANASTLSGVPFDVSVQAIDSLGHVATGYTGTVEITSSDPAASLPAPEVLIQGAGRFLATLRTVGTHAVTATDQAGSIAGSTSVSVPAITSYGGDAPTGTGFITASFTGGGPRCSFATARFLPLAGDPSSPPLNSVPAGLVFPHGLFDFKLTGCTPGSTITMAISYPDALAQNATYWKYGPLPGPIAAKWYELPAARSGNLFTFSITDGQAGDDDLTPDGTIIDQGGPAIPVGIPTLSATGWILLVLALVLGAVFALRR
jgi:uncharacterized repeat protein (TIGR01451 family)